MKFLEVIKQLANDLVGLFYPVVCVCCKDLLITQEKHLCLKCRLSLPKTHYHSLPSNPLDQKFVFEPKVQKVAAYLFFIKGGSAQKIIYQLKYHNNQSIGVMIGEWYGNELINMEWPVDMIIPVPLHKSKLRKRGYNQSECFAEGLSNSTGWTVNKEIIIRTQNTTTQTKKSKVDRWKNMQSVYAITDSTVLNGKTVAVVDDVLTTGATIGELITLLSNSGVKAIYILTIAAGR